MGLLSGISKFVHSSKKTEDRSKERKHHREDSVKILEVSPGEESIGAKENRLIRRQLGALGGSHGTHKKNINRERRRSTTSSHSSNSHKHDTEKSGVGGELISHSPAREPSSHTRVRHTEKSGRKSRKTDVSEGQRGVQREHDRSHSHTPNSTDRHRYPHSRSSSISGSFSSSQPVSPGSDSEVASLTGSSDAADRGTTASRSSPSNTHTPSSSRTYPGFLAATSASPSPSPAKPTYSPTEGPPRNQPIAFENRWDDTDPYQDRSSRRPTVNSSSSSHRHHHAAPTCESSGGLVPPEGIDVTGMGSASSHRWATSESPSADDKQRQPRLHSHANDRRPEDVRHGRVTTPTRPLLAPPGKVVSPDQSARVAKNTRSMSHSGSGVPLPFESTHTTHFLTSSTFTDLSAQKRSPGDPVETPPRPMTCTSPPNRPHRPQDVTGGMSTSPSLDRFVGRSIPSQPEHVSPASMREQEMRNSSWGSRGSPNSPASPPAAEENNVRPETHNLNQKGEEELIRLALSGGGFDGFDDFIDFDDFGEAGNISPAANAFEPPFLGIDRGPTLKSVERPCHDTITMNRTNMGATRAATGTASRVVESTVKTCDPDPEREFVNYADYDALMRRDSDIWLTRSDSDRTVGSKDRVFGLTASGNIQLQNNTSSSVSSVLTGSEFNSMEFRSTAWDDKPAPRSAASHLRPTFPSYAPGDSSEGQRGSLALDPASNGSTSSETDFHYSEITKRSGGDGSLGQTSSGTNEVIHAASETKARWRGQSGQPGGQGQRMRSSSEANLDSTENPYSDTDEGAEKLMQALLMEKTKHDPSQHQEYLGKLGHRMFDDDRSDGGGESDFYDAPSHGPGAAKGSASSIATVSHFSQASQGGEKTAEYEGIVPWNMLRFDIGLPKKRPKRGLAAAAPNAPVFSQLRFITKHMYEKAGQDLLGWAGDVFSDSVEREVYDKQSNAHPGKTLLSRLGVIGDSTSPAADSTTTIDEVPGKGERELRPRRGDYRREATTPTMQSPEIVRDNPRLRTSSVGDVDGSGARAASRIVGQSDSGTDRGVGGGLGLFRRPSFVGRAAGSQARPLTHMNEASRHGGTNLEKNDKPRPSGDCDDQLQDREPGISAVHMSFLRYFAGIPERGVKPVLLKGHDMEPPPGLRTLQRVTCTLSEGRIPRVNGATFEQVLGVLLLCKKQHSWFWRAFLVVFPMYSPPSRLFELLFKAYVATLTLVHNTSSGIQVCGLLEDPTSLLSRICHVIHTWISLYPFTFTTELLGYVALFFL
eukprot:Rmarinus@m.6430